MIDDLSKKRVAALNHRFWAFGPWPPGNSSTVFLASAVHEVGRAMFQGKWEGDEPLAFQYVPDYPTEDELRAKSENALAGMVLKQALRPAVNVARRSPKIDWAAFAASQNTNALRQPSSSVDLLRPTPEQLAASAEKARQARDEERAAWSLAVLENQVKFARLRIVTDWIAAMGRENDVADDRGLVTILRYVDNKTYPQFFSARPGVWNSDHPLGQRFAECSFQYRVAETMASTWPVYVFVTRESLTRCIATIGQPERNDAAKRAGRPKGAGSFELQDEPFLAEMQSLMVDGTSRWRAAGIVAERAGGQSVGAAQSRLSKRYREKYGA